MSSKIFILLCVLWSFLQVSQQQSASEGTWDNEYPGNWYKSFYESVNEFLVENVDVSESMATNMDRLVEMMNLAKPSEANRKQMIVLKKLSALKTLGADCNQISHEILKDNDEATDFKSHDIAEKNSSPRRIDKLINYYGALHAIVCQEKTATLFKPRMRLMNKQVLERLSKWLDPVIERILANHGEALAASKKDDSLSSKLFFGIVKRDGQDPEIFNVKHAYEVLKAFAGNNPDEEKYFHHHSDELSGQRQFHGEEIRQLFEKYLEGSCKAYNREFGKLFESASYNAAFHHDVNSEEPQFYRAWAYSKICTDLFVQPEYNWVWEPWPMNDLEMYAKEIADNEKED